MFYILLTLNKLLVVVKTGLVSRECFLLEMNKNI